MYNQNIPGGANPSDPQVPGQDPNQGQPNPVQPDPGMGGGMPAPEANPEPTSPDNGGTPAPEAPTTPDAGQGEVPSPSEPTNGGEQGGGTPVV